MTYEEYNRNDATGLAMLVKKAEVSPMELTSIALARLDAVNPTINAVIHRYDDRAFQMARASLPNGAFRGVPFLLKDLPDGALEGTPLTMGSRCLRQNRASQDSELVKRYKRAGVVFIGSTNTPEFGLMGTTEPELYGPTRNPWNVSRSAGGSSGGAAAAVAAGVVPVAHANDGGGSIRIPASACGLFGFKPTRGRMPMGPDAAEVWNGFAIPHVISRSVRDSATFLRISHGPDIGAPYRALGGDDPEFPITRQKMSKLRVALVRQSILGQHTHADCCNAVEDAGRLMEDLGHRVEVVDLPIESHSLRLAYLTVVAACTAEGIHAMGQLVGRQPRHDDVEAATWFMAQVGHALSAAELEIARTTIGTATRKLAHFHDTYDVIMSPTMAYPPVSLGELLPNSIERLGLTLLRTIPIKSALKRVLVELAAAMIEKTPNTMLFNMTGQPAMSVPLYWNTDRMPIGIQFAGPLGSETLLFRLASQLESARPWIDNRPAI